MSSQSGKMQDFKETNWLLSNFRTLSKMEHQSAVCDCYGNSGEHYHLVFCEIKGMMLGCYVKVI